MHTMMSHSHTHTNTHEQMVLGAIMIIIPLVGVVTLTFVAMTWFMNVAVALTVRWGAEFARAVGGRTETGGRKGEGKRS